MNHTLEVLRSPHAVVRKIIHSGLSGFNRASLMPDLRTEDLAVVIRDPSSKEIVGGLWAHTSWEWLTVEMIFVPEALRHQGIARHLLALAEEEAAHRGCHSAWLDTLDPDAASLYESLGYERFGELKNFPKGGSRLFFQKALEPVSSDKPRQSSASTAQRS